MNNRRTIIITGSSGLVGSGLVSYFSKLGFQIRAFQRTVPGFRSPLVTYYAFDLADVQDQGFAGADYLIHCAYRPVTSKEDRESGINVDIEGTKRVIALCRRHSIKIVFLSTLSAHSGAKSYYARNKLLAEGLFDVKKDLILKLGIVLGGNGGLFGRILSSLRRYTVVPLIGGERLAQTIALDDLCRIIEIGLHKNIVGSFRISHPVALSLNTLYRKMAHSIDVKPFFVPISWAMAYRLLQLAERLGLKLPFTSENVLGLRDLKTYDTAKDLEVFGLKVKDYQTTLDQLHAR